MSFALARIYNEITRLPDYVSIVPKDSEQSNLVFTMVIQLKDGFFKSAILYCDLFFPEEYPFLGPKVYIQNKEGLIHPNVDVASGGVCLEFLRVWWKPTFGLVDIYSTILVIFTEPLPSEDALNPEACELLINNKMEFIEKAKMYAEENNSQRNLTNCPIAI